MKASDRAYHLRELSAFIESTDATIEHLTTQGQDDPQHFDTHERRRTTITRARFSPVVAINFGFMVEELAEAMPGERKRLLDTLAAAKSLHRRLGSFVNQPRRESDAAAEPLLRSHVAREQLKELADDWATMKEGEMSHVRGLIGGKKAKGGQLIRNPKGDDSKLGGVNASLASALVFHHGLRDTWVKESSPIGSNKLAKSANVSPGSASNFFKEHFGGHDEYAKMCLRNKKKLIDRLKVLNGDTIFAFQQIERLDQIEE